VQRKNAAGAQKMQLEMSWGGGDAEAFMDGDGGSCPVNEQIIWQALCVEARADADMEPALASYLFSTILAHKSLEDALAFVLANKLRSNVLLDSQLLVGPGRCFSPPLRCH